MIFYWIILAFKRIVWFFWLPKPEDVAIANLNERCPVCGWKQGWVRCVHKVKHGPQNREVAPDVMVLRQHTCKICGASWFHHPIAKDTKPTLVLASVSRDEIERKQDHRSQLATPQESTS